MSSIASVAAQQQANTTSSSSTSSSDSTSGQNAIDQLSGNFQDFLQMLMTQLQNQDPTSPLDTNEFTQELVEFPASSSRSTPIRASTSSFRSTRRARSSRDQPWPEKQ